MPLKKCDFTIYIHLTHLSAPSLFYSIIAVPWKYKPHGQGHVFLPPPFSPLLVNTYLMHICWIKQGINRKQNEWMIAPRTTLPRNWARRRVLTSWLFQAKGSVLSSPLWALNVSLLGVLTEALGWSRFRWIISWSSLFNKKCHNTFIHSFPKFLLSTYFVQTPFWALRKWCRQVPCMSS